MHNHCKAAEAANPKPRKGGIVSEANVESPSARLAKVLDEAERRRQLRAASTVRLYTLKTKDSPYGIPFAAVNDHFALLAAKQLLPLADCYCIGEFCLYDGVCKSYRKPVICLDNKVE